MITEKSFVMSMINRLIGVFFFFYSGMLLAQENRIAIIPSDGIIQSYLSKTNKYAALYNGKVEIPYERRFENHPYFETEGYVKGTLCYNHVVYTDVYLRLDLYRDELTVYLPGSAYQIVLENEKFDYAILNGSTIIISDNEVNSKKQFLVLLHNGIYPVRRKYNLIIYEEYSSFLHTIKNFFQIQIQYVIYINGVPHSIKNQNSILKLFADRKKELKDYAKQNKLNFKKQPEQSILALVNQYESLNK